MILTTHHHADHVEANLALKQRFGLKIIGPEAEADKIPGHRRDGRRRLRRSSSAASRIAGHRDARPHGRPRLATISRDRASLFAADTLFALGCGRLFEGTPPVMCDSLKKLAALPAETVVYCGHEYTLSNARFALTVDPTNSALKERVGRDRDAARRRQADRCRRRSARNWRPTRSCAGTTRRSAAISAWRTASDVDGLRRDPQAQGQFLACTATAAGDHRDARPGAPSRGRLVCRDLSRQPAAGAATRPRSTSCSNRATSRPGTGSATRRRSGTIYAGAPLDADGLRRARQAANAAARPRSAAGERPQAIVPAGWWQTARSLGDWTLVGCTVAPGFDFAPFELARAGWEP